MTLARLKTTGMHCGSCAKRIEMEVADLAGVSRVKADPVEGVTEVDYDETQVDVDAIIAAVRSAGYDAQAE